MSDAPNPLPFGRVIDMDTASGREYLTPQAVQSNFDAISGPLFDDVVKGVVGSGRVIANGTGTWTWPGGTVKSNATVVNHGLGGVPALVVTFPNQTQGAVEVLFSEAYGYTGTQFSTRGRFVALVPGAGAVATFVWFALR